MHGIIYEEETIWQFLLITCVLGGWAAWMTGRATARNWSGYGHLVVYILLLGCGVRFIHFALFAGSLITLHYYAVDVVILLVLGCLGFQYTRTNQMTVQYNWLYEKTSALGWRAKT